MDFSLNCFLAEATYALTLSGVPILDVLGLGVFISIVKFLKRNPIPAWFVSLSEFVGNGGLGDNLALASRLTCDDVSCDISFVSKCLLVSECSLIEVYTDSSVRGIRIIGACGGAAVYFPATDMSVSIRVYGLLFLTLVELQAIALALECMLAFSAVILFMNSQTLLNMCKFGVSVSEKKHIYHSISKKNLSVMWKKIKRHSSIVGNEQADFFANAAVTSKSVLSFNVPYCFFGIENQSVLGNMHHFVRGLFNAINFVNWKSKCAFYVVDENFACIINMSRSFNIWHSNIAVRKRLYNPKYPSILCIRCGLIEDLDHSFLCEQDKIMEDLVVKSICEAGSAGGLYMILAKKFVLKSWMANAVHHFGS
ncbi:hypothetical protein G9A89_009344 [Geosiphon pyriformis]|nr:hypothetical protein G9A89_009344 [Geosiphon pyriformis]